jgi:hypothetical protein
MTVVCGRARSGAGSVLRAMICGTFAILGLVTSGCGSNTITYGTAVFTVSATPGPFKAYQVYIDAVTITRTDGTLVSLFGNQAIAPERVDFTQLQDMTELFGAPAVLEGTYTSASITVDYTGAAIAVDVAGGGTQLATVLDSTGAVAGIVTYTVNFDPAHPLVLTNGVSTPINLNLDLAAAGVTTLPTTGPTVTVTPYLTASTQPALAKVVRARGQFVTGAASAGSFTVNTRPNFETTTDQFGALTVQTDANTTYNVNGVNYQGATGLAAVGALPIDTDVLSYGAITDQSTITPVFKATEVYAGTSILSVLARVTGTVAARTGNALDVHGATIFGIVGNTAGIVDFESNLQVNVDGGTLVSQNGMPNKTVTSNSISIGQKVDLAAQILLDTNGNIVGADATGPFGGSVRLVSTPAWGTLNSSGAGTASLDLTNLGDYEPSSVAFVGTHAPAGTDANPAAYNIDTSAVTGSIPAAPSLVRFDGFVNGFGSAGADFAATTVTAGTATDQELFVNYINGGAVTPFVAPISASGLKINIATATNLGTFHLVQTGPFTLAPTAGTLDLTNPVVNPILVPAATAEFTIGNPTAGIAVFNEFDAFLTQVQKIVNGTNALQKIVAVGHYEPTTGVFTATRIDLLQQ